MGANHSVHPDVEDLDIEEDSSLCRGDCCSSTRKIALNNLTPKKLYIAIADANDDKKIRELNAGLNVGLDGAGANLHVAWDFSRQTNVAKATVPAGKERIFNVAGDCGFLWISTAPDFSGDKTPFASFRLQVGQRKYIQKEEIAEDIFQVRSMGACQLSDIRGIGRAYEKKLQDAGFTSRQDLLDKFVSLGRDHTAMTHYLQQLKINRNFAAMATEDLAREAAQMG